MPEPVFVIARDARSSLVHIRRRDDGECVGCIEVGLYEIVRTLVLAETKGDGNGGHREGDTSSAPPLPWDHHSPRPGVLSRNLTQKEGACR
jgi:hypothetical protein